MCAGHEHPPRGEGSPLSFYRNIAEGKGFLPFRLTASTTFAGPAIAALRAIQPGTHNQRHPGLLLLEAEPAVKLRAILGEERHMMAGDAFEQPPHDRRAKASAAMRRGRPHVDQPRVADPVRKYPGGCNDLRTIPDDGGGVTVLERPPQLLRGAAVVEPVGGERIVERLPVDALEVVAYGDRRRQLRPPGRSVASGSG